MNELRTTDNELKPIVDAVVKAVLQQLQSPLISSPEAIKAPTAMDVSGYLLGFRKSLRIQEGLDPVTAESYGRKVVEFFDWLEKKYAVSFPGSVTTEHVEGFLENLYYRKNAARTRNLKLLAIKRFFGYLKYTRVLVEDVTADVPKAKVHRGLIQKFSRKEILKIFKALDPSSEKGLRDITIFILGTFCGLRISEIRNLNLSDLAFNDAGCLDISVGNQSFNPKADSFRTVDLWKAPSDKIRQWIAIRQLHSDNSDALLISYTRGDHPRLGKRMPNHGIYNLIKQSARSVKIKKRVAPHMLRASAASTLRHVKGYDTFSAAERLGHSFVSSMDPYICNRSKVGKQYPSLAAYWREFKSVWDVEQPEASTGV